MRFTGHLGKGRGHRQRGRARLCQRPIKRRETHIVADGKPKAAVRSLREYSIGARRHRRRFLIDLPLPEVDIEHMDLVIARCYSARRVQQIGAVVNTAIVGLYTQRPQQNQDSQLPRQESLVYLSEQLDCNAPEA